MQLPTLFRKPPISAVMLRERALVPAIPAARPIKSEIATALRDGGVFICTGTVTGWNETPGQAAVPVQITSPDLAAATQQVGAANITLSLDAEASRYLHPRARVRIAVQVLTDENDA